MACERGQHAKRLIHEAHKQILRDFEHIAEDKVDWVAMGEAKPARKIVIECAGAYKWQAAKMRGEDNADEIWGEVCEMDPATREDVVKLAEECWEELAAALDGLTDEQLGEKRQVFWGESTVGDLAHFCEWHNTYHSGQLNYIQLLLGDVEVHMG